MRVADFVNVFLMAPLPSARVKYIKAKKMQIMAMMSYVRRKFRAAHVDAPKNRPMI